MVTSALHLLEASWRRPRRHSAPSTAAPVSVPDWTVAGSPEFGGVHRWPPRRRCTERDRAPQDPTRPGPDGTADEWADWLADGGRRLVATLRAADGAAPMWTWGDGTDVAWWTRRQLHETLVHRIDALQAAGAEWSVDPEVAVDAIDEHLGNIAASAYFSSGVANLKGDGSLHLHATDTEGEWMIELRDDGFDISHAHGKGTVAARGAAGDLLAAVTNRGTTETLQVFGAADLLRWWMTNSALD